MSSFITSWPSLAALLLIPAVASISIVPFSDGQCENSLMGNFTFDDIETVGAYFVAGEGAPNYRNYDNLEFTGANAPDNGPGYSVYWHITDLDRACRVVFLLPFVEKLYGATSDAGVEGAVIMNAGSDGCVYTNLPVDAQLQITFCCGQGDCTPFAVGNSQIISREVDDEEPARRDIESRDNDPATDLEVSIEEVPGESWSVGSIASRVITEASKISQVLKPRSTCDTLECFDEAWASCDIQPGDSYSRAGTQTAISASQPCPGGNPGGVCSLAASGALTFGTALTTTEDTTTTTTGGVTISQSAGIDWPIDLVFTAAVSVSFARAVSNSVGKTISNSTTMTVTNTIGQTSGTTAFMTFTPSYTCYSPAVDCIRSPGTFTYNPGVFTEICWPDLLDNGAPDGSYSLAYIS